MAPNFRSRRLMFHMMVRNCVLQLYRREHNRTDMMIFLLRRMDLSGIARLSSALGLYGSRHPTVWLVSLFATLFIHNESLGVRVALFRDRAILI